jgi:hypothetical protein
MTGVGPVELSLPPETRTVRIARLVAGAVADEAGFDFDAVEDLRIGVGELCFAVLEAGQPAGPLELRVVELADRVEVTGRVPLQPASTGTPEPTSLMSTLLGAVVDSHSVAVVDGAATFSLHKLRPPGP